MWLINGNKYLNGCHHHIDHRGCAVNQEGYLEESEQGEKAQRHEAKTFSYLSKSKPWKRHSTTLVEG